MARFVETFKDWIVSFPNRYKIIEDGQEKTVEIERDWEPDVEGTSNNERVMNELVKNITYDTDTVHTTESGTSVYICDLVGMKEFTEYSSSDSSFIPKISAQINTTNSNQLSKIRISGKDGSVSDYDLYTINNGVYSLLRANKLKPNTIVIIKIVSNGANKIAVVQYLMDDKLDKGTYSGNASNLKAEIDGKMDKYKNSWDSIFDYDDIVEDGFYIVRGLAHGAINAPHEHPTLVQVWRYYDDVYQNAVSYYDVQAQFTRCFKIGTKNTKWEKIVNTTDIVNNLTTTVPEKVLDARQGPAIVNKINGLAGGYSGTFPLTTAVKEGIYLLPATNKFYVCVENYSGSSLTSPNANFEELSVFQNRNKLQNLANKNEFKALKNFPLNTIKLTQTPQEFSLTLEEMKALEYVVVYDVDFISSSKSKFIFGNLARAEDGEYWVQVPSGEEINFHVFENKLYMSADSGSRPVCISSIFYR